MTVNAVHAGNRANTRTKALSALNSGDPPRLAAMFSIDACDLIGQDLTVPFEDVIEDEAERVSAGRLPPRRAWASPLVFAARATFHGAADAVNFNLAAPWTPDIFRQAAAGGAPADLFPRQRPAGHPRRWPAGS